MNILWVVASPESRSLTNSLHRDGLELLREQGTRSASPTSTR